MRPESDIRRDVGGLAGSLLQKHATRRPPSARSANLTFLHCTKVQKFAARAARPRRATRRDLGQPVHDGVRRALGVADLGRRDRAVRDVDGAQPGVLGAPDVVEEPVADVDAAGRVGRSDRVHRRAERVRGRLGPRDLARVDVAVDEVVHAVAAEEALVPRPRPDRVGEHADLDAPCAQRLEQRPDLRVGERVRLPELVVRRQQLGVVLEPGLGEEVGHGRALLVVAGATPDRLVGGVQPLRETVDVVVDVDRPPGRAPATPRGSRRRASG